MTDDEFVLQMKRLISFQRYMYSTIRLADVLAARPAPTWFYRFDYQAPTGLCGTARWRRCNRLEVRLLPDGRVMVNGLEETRILEDLFSNLL